MTHTKHNGPMWIYFKSHVLLFARLYSLTKSKMCRFDIHFPSFYIGFLPLLCARNAIDAFLFNVHNFRCLCVVCCSFTHNIGAFLATRCVPEIGAATKCENTDFSGRRRCCCWRALRSFPSLHYLSVFLVCTQFNQSTNVPFGHCSQAGMCTHWAI